MTIKTWRERMMERMIMEPTDKQVGQSMQAQIDELCAENLRQDLEYIEQGLRLIQLEERLDAWENQEPVAYRLLDKYPGLPDQWVLYSSEELLKVPDGLEPLYTKPKEPT
jgi:enoyl reductase-like protein